MKNEQKYIEFLNHLSNILAKRISPATTVFAVNKVFSEYLNTTKVSFVIWDDNNMMLKDFAQDWIVYDTNNQQSEINYIYTNIAERKGEVFFCNEKEYKCNIQEQELFTIDENIQETNKIQFPLESNGALIGLLIIETTKQSFDTEYFKILNISAKLMSGAITNYILNEQMDVSLNFYKAMKDIAKIIESQYELSYIIPLIGEMIDRFMSAHLIYIFIKKEDKYKLVWPNACKDQNVYELLEKITLKSDYLISENSKIGVFPIVNEDNILGAIVAYSNIEKLLQKDIDYLLQLTRQSGLTIQRANVYAEVLKSATLDALTGLNNRRQFEIRLKQEVSNSRRNNTQLCCMMLDVDYFKKVNDTYGHAAGDCVLRNVSEVIKTEIREYDIACRYGGEEFFIILPQTNIQEASLVAQRLRKVIEETKMDISEAGVADTSYLKVTVSIGICSFEQTMTPNEFAQKADKALYEAKTRGRNRVIVM